MQCLPLGLTYVKLYTPDYSNAFTQIKHNVQMLDLVVDVFNKGGNQKLEIPTLLPPLVRWVCI